MSNLTSVGLTSGVPTSGTGTVSTIDQLLVKIADGTAQTKLTDGTNVPAVKAASTTAAATDPALVVAISPNGQNANGQATMSNSAAVVIASDQSSIPVNGDVASGSSDSGKPVKIGAVAHTAAPTAVTDGQRVNVITDKVGKLVTVPAIRDLVVQSAVVTLTSTSETTLIAAVASTFLDLVSIKLSNTSATAVRCDLRDATAGTVIDTFYLPAGDVRGVVYTVPWKQTTVNNNWTVQLSGSVTDVRITAQFVKNI